MTPPPSLSPPRRVLYQRSGVWSDGTVPILATTAAGFTYIAFLMVSASSSIHRGHAPTLANVPFVVAGCEQFSSVSLARFVRGSPPTLRTVI